MRARGQEPGKTGTRPSAEASPRGLSLQTRQDEGGSRVAMTCRSSHRRLIQRARLMSAHSNDVSPSVSIYSTQESIWKLPAAEQAPRRRMLPPVGGLCAGRGAARCEA